MKKTLAGGNCRPSGMSLGLSAGLSLLLLLPSLAAATDFAACRAELRPQALAAGVAAADFDRLTATLEPDLEVLRFLDAQPEFVTPIWDYLAGLVDDERVVDGQAAMAQWQALLARIETRFAVEPAVVVAIWGVESNYGRNFGKRPLLESLSALSCHGRRQKFFRGELFTTMKIISDGDVAAERLQGSWAGAFGHTQFMPSTFSRLAVDFDGDGRRDLVDSVPDALASTANFLKRAGWRAGLPWGVEVKLPAAFDVAVAGRRNKRSLEHWAGAGLRLRDGRALSAALPPATPTALLLPAGSEGPALLVTRNFDALFSYNAAESYALAIAHLSDRLQGAGGFVQPWPTDDPGLSRAERRELQQLLSGRGHDIGEIDGIIGARTREALRQEQAALGLPIDGRAGQRSLQALRAAP